MVRIVVTRIRDLTCLACISGLHPVEVSLYLVRNGASSTLRSRFSMEFHYVERLAKLGIFS